jgi:hypothetical protein
VVELFQEITQIPKHLDTKLVSTNLQSWLLQGLEINEKIYQEYQNERFVQTTVKLSGTISKVTLPRFNTQATAGQYTNNEPKKTIISSKLNCCYFAGHQNSKTTKLQY